VKLLFVHDHVYLAHNGEVHSNTFSYAFFKSYLEVFSEVTVVARMREVEAAGADPSAGGEGVRFVFLKNIATPGSFLGLRRRQARIIARLMEEHDALIVRLPSEFGIMAAGIASRKHRDYLAEVVGCAFDAMWYYGGWKARLYAPVFFLKMRHAVRHASHVAYVTQAFLQQRYPASGQAETLALSDVSLPPYDANALTVRLERIRKREGRIVCGTIANLNLRYKGIDSALKAVAALAAGGNAVEYRLLGEGDPARYLALAEKLGIRQLVFFEGKKVSGEDIRRWLERIDLYILPSLTEGLPRSLIEAMDRACPAVASSVGGIPELLEPSALFPPGDAEALAEKVTAFVSDRQKMAQSAERNHAVAKRYGRENLEKKRGTFLRTFRDACRGKRD
jgi:glycosyltransferase involved in cell wall biosynthesis